MAKRKTIGENPLDSIKPYPLSRQQELKSTTPKPRSTNPASPASARRPVHPVPASHKPEKGAATPARLTQSHTPPQQHLLSRIQSLEEQNTWIKWVAYGAIGLALVL